MVTWFVLCFYMWQISVQSKAEMSQTNGQKKELISEYEREWDENTKGNDIWLLKKMTADYQMKWYQTTKGNFIRIPTEMTSEYQRKWYHSTDTFSNKQKQVLDLSPF